MSNIKCFYHSSDLDGHCSGALVGVFHHWDVDFCPINYNEPFPWNDISKDDTVYMVDFGLQPFSDMIKLNSMCNLIWIDHHVTAIEDYNKSGTDIKGIREVGKAGCELVWDHLFGYHSDEGDVPMPEVVYLLGRYDVWEWKTTKNSLEFQYGMRLQGNTHPSNHDLWDTLITEDENTIQDIINNGITLLEYEQIQNEKHCQYLAFETEIDNHPAIAINRGGTNSKIFDSVWDSDRHDLMITFVRKDERWNVSLYTSKDGVNVGEIAKEHGGGGHAGAAGFSCYTLPFKY